MKFCIAIFRIFDVFYIFSGILQVLMLFLAKKISDVNFILFANITPY